LGIRVATRRPVAAMRVNEPRGRPTDA